jgi:hypothetical protein
MICIKNNYFKKYILLGFCFIIICKNIVNFFLIITNFMGHDLTIIVVWNLFFISSYGINTNVNQLFILFEHWYCAHCLDTNVKCLFVLFRHGCCIFIHDVYTWKSCTWLPCLNNAWHLCLNNIDLKNNIFHMDLEWTHEACKFVMMWTWYKILNGCPWKNTMWIHKKVIVVWFHSKHQSNYFKIMTCRTIVLQPWSHNMCTKMWCMFASNQLLSHHLLKWFY